MVRLSFYPVGDHYLWVVVAALALMAMLAIGPSAASLTRGRRLFLAGLRVAVILLVILAMLRPTLVYTKTTKQAATLVVLSDQSKSMSVRDMAGGRSRYEAMRDALQDAQGDLKRLASDFEVKAYGFDAEAHPIDVVEGRLKLPERPEGEQTAIGSVLEDVVRNEAGKRILGVLLLSDGAQRAYPPRDVLPQTAASRLKSLGYPLYTCRFGQARGLGQTQDVAVSNLLANPTVFVKNELTVSAEVRVDGYANRDLPVNLLFETSPGKMEVVDQKTIRATADGQIIPVRFQYLPKTPGEYKVTVEAAEQDGELVTTNNRLSTFVRVLKGGLNVLYLETPRPELRFLRRSLDASPDIRVDYLPFDPRHPEDRPADLEERFEPGKYEVYILGDIDSSAFTPKQLQTLADSVARGAGLIMLGGSHSFGPGGYADTPLADVLPIRMDRLERQPLNGPEASDLQLLGPQAMLPTTRARNHFALMLTGTPQENLDLWKQLPPLDGANRFRGLKPDAQVLAATAQDQPLLVAHTFGNGRTMAFAGDSTWKWVLHGFGNAHKRFWRQTILWLARKDESLEGNVWIRLAQRRFGPGQRVEFAVGADAPNGEPVANASFHAEILPPEGDPLAVDLVRNGGQTTGSFRQTPKAGDYTIRLTADKDGQPLGSTQARFLVFEENLELDNAAADATVLDSLAAMTGGKSLAPEELPELIRQLMRQTDRLEVKTEAKQSLWDGWPFFFLLIGLLGTEWYLRKCWGLV